jgi:hypothetical protein
MQTTKEITRAAAAMGYRCTRMGKHQRWEHPINPTIAWGTIPHQNKSERLGRTIIRQLEQRLAQAQSMA